MSRKHRNKQPVGGARPGVAVAVAKPPAQMPDPERKPPAQPSPEVTWLEHAWRRGSRVLGSLQAAVILLTIFAAVLAIGTVVESKYNGRIAQEIVYRSWWFALLLFLLGVNIFFAAAKKWPWKKHQTGFLITHVGLLTMLAGGILNSLSGTDALVTLVDTNNKELRESIGLPSSTRQMYLPDDHQIVVRRLDKDGKEKLFDFHPGSFLWRDDQHLESDVHPALRFLCWLADPVPKHWSQSLGDGAELSVGNFYPHARQEPFSAARKDAPSFAAVKLQFVSPQAGRVPPFWVALSEQRGEDRQWSHQNFGPAMAEIVGLCPPEMLNEFLKPPPPEQLAGKGQLVVRVGGDLHRLNVEANLGRLIALGDTGHRIRIRSYLPRLSDEDRPESERIRHAPDPIVHFEHTDPRGATVEYRATSRLMTRGGAVDSKGQLIRDPGTLQWWYHPPDFRYGLSEEKLKGLLQLTQTPDGRLYYRAFHQDAGAFRLDASGLLMEPATHAEQKSELIPIWKRMKWQFQVVEYLPAAEDRARLVPENRRPGLQRQDLRTAIRCKLKNKTDTQEFLLGREQTMRVTCGGERFAIGYSMKTEPLGFELALLRAEQQVDPGTQSSATFTSFVQVTDDGQSSGRLVPSFARPLTNFIGLTRGGIVAQGEDHVITMNEPLEWRGFQVFQSQYEFRNWDEKERPVSLSGFTVARDPGLFLKYLGSSMLALGIACMFYMKAYFFAPRGRKLTPSIPATEVPP
jgi:hypothetical protein